MLTISSLLVLFAFGLVITGVVYLGITQAREEARARRRVKAAEDSAKPDLRIIKVA